MHSLPRPVDDPMMRKLLALVQARLPGMTHEGRPSLLKRLHALEREALKQCADPGTLRSIRATQAFVRRWDLPPDAEGHRSDGV